MPQEVLFVILGIVAFVALIVGLILLGRHMAKKRTKAMKAIAADLGMEFSTTERDALLEGLQRFSLFSGGRNHQVKNVMKSRKESANLTIADHSYITRGGRSTQYHFHTVLVMESDSLRLPVFALRPKGLADRVGVALGAQDIDFGNRSRPTTSFTAKNAKSAKDGHGKATDCASLSRYPASVTCRPWRPWRPWR